MASDVRSWTHNRLIRAGAVAAVILGPIAAVPLLLASASSAAQACVDGTGVDPGSSDLSTGSATVQEYGGGCTVVSLVEYSETSGSTGTGSTPATYPQTLVAVATADVQQGETVTLTVPLQAPTCATQIDLIYGTDTPQTLTTAYFAAHNTLITHANFGATGCTPTPPICSSTAPAPSSSAPTVTATDTSATATDSATSTATSTATGSPGGATSATGSTSTTSTTVTATPTCTTGPSGTPTTTSSSPAPVSSTTSSSPTTPTSSLSSSVLATATSTSSSGAATTTSVGPTNTQSTSVLALALSKGPESGVLPFTGPGLPVRDGLLAALAALTIGAGLVLLSGRMRPAGAHRRG